MMMNLKKGLLYGIDNYKSETKSYNLLNEMVESVNKTKLYNIKFLRYISNI